MGFLVELKRRKVFRVAAVYAATGFVVVEAADIMLPRLGVPEWAVSLVVVLVVLGLPVALVLAWALELTPDGVRVATPATDPAEPPPSLLGRRTAVLAGSLVILGTGLGAGWFLSPTGGPAGPTVDVAAAGSPGTGSIAVLPFLNMSADPGNEYFAEGIAEELLNVLVRVEGLGVASRTSSFAYKGREIGAVAIARELNVGHILEGIVRKEGNRVRVAVQLIDAVNDRHLWAETYDRDLDDIFAVQSDVVQQIAKALRARLAPAVLSHISARPSHDMKAYDPFVRARQDLYSVRPERIVQTIDQLEEAVALDPAFAETNRRGAGRSTAACR
jgi:TolB-like protein